MPLDWYRLRHRAITCATIAPVNLERASGLTVVGLCAIATLLLAVNGYSGYSIVAAAVGAAAAVNLIPARQ